MTRVVVDASVFFASLIADGPTRALLLGPHPLELHTPAALQVELESHLPEIAKRTGKPVEVVSALLQDLLGNVEVAPVALYASAWASARDRCAKAHTAGDEAYVALAGVLSAPIWTYDKDFRRIRGVTVLTTTEVRRLAVGKGTAFKGP